MASEEAHCWRCRCWFCCCLVLLPGARLSGSSPGGFAHGLRGVNGCLNAIWGVWPVRDATSARGVPRRDLGVGLGENIL
jgi:hypothetical protein